MANKNNQGGQKLIKPMKINKARKLQLTFLKKRCFGIFKKARELATLCGAEAAIMASHPEGKILTYGSPSFELVTERFLSKKSLAHGEDISELVRQQAMIERELELEWRRGEELKQAIEAEKDHELYKLFTAPVEELNLQQLEKLEAAIVELTEKLTKKIADMEATNPPFDANGSGYDGST